MAKRKATKKKATKRKAAPKKAAKKKAARKVAKKKVAKKKVAKKAVAKRAVTKKAAKKKASKKKAAKKKAAKKKAAKKKGAKRKPNPAFMRPLTPDAALGAVVGTKALPRTEVVKKLWSYIKRNNLQDTENKRMINADDKLRDLFGGKDQVSMFEMTKLVSQHLG